MKPIMKPIAQNAKDYARLVNTNPKTLTDLERAARFLYLQRTAFGGKVSGKNFGVSVGLPSRFDLTKLVPMLEDVHERLSNWILKHSCIAMIGQIRCSILIRHIGVAKMITAKRCSAAMTSPVWKGL